MYCKRCFAALPDEPETIAQATVPSPYNQPGGPIAYWPKPPPDLNRCPSCGRRYDRNRPDTFLRSITLSPWQIAFRVALTTLLGIAAAYVVAFHQMAQASGH